MANTIAYAQVFQQALDEQMLSGAATGWMELNAALVKYNGGNEVKIPKMVMDGMADYDRSSGFVAGGVTLSWETHAMTMDRGRTFSLDAMDVNESNFVATGGAVMGMFQREKVIPEVDAYRLSAIATKAINATQSVDYTAASATILATLRGQIAVIQDNIGENAPLVISMSFAAANVLDMADNIAKQLGVADFVQGNVTLKVRAIDGIPIIRVPSARMKTAYVFNDGTTEGQTAGGFTADVAAQDINWIISARRSIIAISKTDKMRIFTPDVNQSADAWKMDYRKYHDIWVPDNKVAGIYACTVALPGN